MAFIFRSIIMPGIFLPAAALAGDELPVPVSAWFDALRNADRAAMAEVLLPGATVELRDIGIVQAREEFLDSFEEWSGAAAVAGIKVRIFEADAEAALVAVCYRFPSNEAGTLEKFVIAQNRIAGSIQEPLEAACGDS